MNEKLSVLNISHQVMTTMIQILKARLWDSELVPLKILAKMLHYCLIYGIREDRDN